MTSPRSGLGPLASDEACDFVLDLMVIDTPLPVEEPAAEPAPTDVEEDTSTSMGEKLRQAVLSGSQDDLKRLFQQCSKLPAKKAVDEKRLAAFSAFDDLLKPQEAVQPAGAPAQPADVSAVTRLEPAVQEVAGGPSSPSRAASGPEMFFIGDDSMAEDLIGGASAPSAPSSQPSYAQAAPAPAPAALTPELVQQLHSNGVSAVANNLTPHQLERMSPQELPLTSWLVQLQAMISSALQARALPAPVAPGPTPSSGWPSGGYRPAPVTNRISSFDMAPKEAEAAPFGELLDMFQKKNTG
eukprot:s999_g13.t1